MAFRNKIKAIMEFAPDILIVQECESVNKLNLNKLNINPRSSFWYGDNPNKGIGIFSFNENTLSHNQDPGINDKWIIPFHVKGNVDFTLISVWAMNHRGNEVINGVGPAFATFTRYAPYYDSNIIISGDFNDNKIWDKDYYKSGSFSDVAKLFDGHGIQSCYHNYYKESFGEESCSTLFWRKSQKTTYHIDYCFASVELLNNMERFAVGKPEDWLSISDHVPIIIDIKT